MRVTWAALGAALAHLLLSDPPLTPELKPQPLSDPNHPLDPNPELVSPPESVAIPSEPATTSPQPPTFSDYSILFADSNFDAPAGERVIQVSHLVSHADGGVSAEHSPPIVKWEGTLITCLGAKQLKLGDASASFIGWCAKHGIEFDQTDPGAFKRDPTVPCPARETRSGQ
jgi:hypothetical protein